MAWKFMEGFEGASPGQLPRIFDVVLGGGALTSGRLGDSALTASSTVFVSRSFGLSTTVICGFGIRLSGTPVANAAVSYKRGADEQIRLEFVNQDANFYRIRVMRGATQLAETTDIAKLAWQFVEFKCNVHPSTGSYELRVNEVTFASDAGPVNTANTGLASVDIWGWNWPGSGGSPLLDDLYVIDDTGSGNDPVDFLGDTRILTKFPEADGNQNDWTRNSGATNFENVDDPTSAQDGTNTVESDTNGQVDLYEADDIAGVVGTVTGVQVSIQARMKAAGTRTIRARIRDASAATEEAGGNEVVSSTTYQDFVHVYADNVDGSPWTVSDVNDTEIGMEVVS